MHVLRKAKTSGNFELIIDGYKDFVDYAYNECAMLYADSMVLLFEQNS